MTESLDLEAILGTDDLNKLMKTTDNEIKVSFANFIGLVGFKFVLSMLLDKQPKLNAESFVDGLIAGWAGPTTENSINAIRATNFAPEDETNEQVMEAFIQLNRQLIDANTKNFKTALMQGMNAELYRSLIDGPPEDETIKE